MPGLEEPEGGKLPALQVFGEEPDFEATLQPDEADLREWVVVRSREVLKYMRTVIKPAQKIADHTALERVTGGLSFDITTLHKPFLAPALMICGRQDSWSGFHASMRLLDECPRGTLAVLDRAGHGVSIEQQALFRALVSEWLDRIEEYAPMVAH